MAIRTHSNADGLYKIKNEFCPRKSSVFCLHGCRSLEQQRCHRICERCNCETDGCQSYSLTCNFLQDFYKTTVSRCDIYITTGNCRFVEVQHYSATTFTPLAEVLQIHYHVVSQCPSEAYIHWLLLCFTGKSQQ